MYAFLADLHLGAPRINNVVYLKTLNKFFEIIKSHKEECECIFVCGDLFDHRFNIDESKFASLFLLNLVCNNCGRTHTHVPVHFIHGTYSHDYEQYEIFVPMLQKIDNVEIFYTKETCIGTLKNGKRVLYLPQIYGDFDYNSYLNIKDKYDIVVGHGPISSTTKTPCKKADSEILHSAEKLGDISNICVFGHYHGYTDFGNNVYYAGPWLRFNYNEDEPRKFFICDNDFNVELFDNPFAVEYKTINISSPDKLRDAIAQGITTPHRFIIETNKDELQTYHSIMTANKKNDNLKFIINNKDKNVIDNNALSDSTVDTNNIEPISALIQYISDRYNIDTSDQINTYSQKIGKIE